MTTAQMGYFIALVEKRSFTAVAELFYVTQPTLSRQIMNLEAELETQLFLRKSNTVTVTPAGMALYDGLKPLYGQLTRLIDSVKRYDDLQRQIFTIGIAEELLLDDPVQLAIGMFSGKHPEVNVSIVRTSYAKLQRGLLDGTISVANTITSSFDMQSGRFEYFRIALEGIYLACSRSLGAALPDPIPLDRFIEVLRHKKLLLGGFDDFGERENIPLDVFHEAFGVFDFEPDIQICGSPLSIPAQVAAGLGVSLSNESNLFAIDPKTALIRIDVPSKRGTCYEKGLVFATEHQSPLLRNFLELVRENMGENPAGDDPWGEKKG